MITEEIKKELAALQDVPYRDFQRKLIPGPAQENLIGVRTPALRKLAKKIARRDDRDEFLTDLPHQYFEENQLHAFVIAEEKNFSKCLAKVQAFLPYIDNWATCDQLAPKAFSANADALLPYIREWIGSGCTYYVRFGVLCLMRYFLDEKFLLDYPDLVAEIRSEEYYVNMVIAWYFATALAKQYDQILPYLQERRLAPWTHNKTIQKAVESYRIGPAQKEELRGYRIQKVGGHRP